MTMTLTTARAVAMQSIDAAIASYTQRIDRITDLSEMPASSTLGGQVRAALEALSLETRHFRLRQLPHVPGSLTVIQSPNGRTWTTAEVDITEFTDAVARLIEAFGSDASLFRGSPADWNGEFAEWFDLHETVAQFVLAAGRLDQRRSDCVAALGGGE